MRDVGIIAYAQSEMKRDVGACNEVEMILPVLDDVLDRAGLDRKEIDFTCSGSCDYLQGASFAFVGAVDTLGACPPIQEQQVRARVSEPPLDSIKSGLPAHI